MCFLLDVIVGSDDASRMLDLTRYPGAKGGEGVWQRIISEMPPHSTYIEAFLGSGVILRKKKAAVTNIGVDADPEVVQAFNTTFGDARSLTVTCGDARSLLKRRTWNGGELVYCDPPYLMHTRSTPRNYYRHEFSEADHRELLTLLRRLPCLVMLSGYWSELYAAMLADWRTVEIPTTNRAGARVTEWLWCNFPRPVLLHDYRFLGRNFRERERIKRKTRRWTGRLARMDNLERAALLSALTAGPSELASRTAAPGSAMQALHGENDDGPPSLDLTSGAGAVRQK